MAHDGQWPRPVDVLAVRAMVWDLLWMGRFTCRASIALFYIMLSEGADALVCAPMILTGPSSLRAMKTMFLVGGHGSRGLVFASVKDGPVARSLIRQCFRG